MRKMSSSTSCWKNRASFAPAKVRDALWHVFPFIMHDLGNSETRKLMS